MPDDLLGAQRAIFLSGLTGVEKLVVLAILAHWSRKESRPWPGVPRLVEWTSFGRNTVLRAIAGLERKGALVVTRRRGAANTYDLGPVFSGALPVPERDQSQSPTSPIERLHQSQSGTGTSPTVGPEVIHEVIQEEIQLVAPSAATPKPRRVARAKPRVAKWTKVPADFQVQAEHRAIARERNVNIELEEAKFRDHEFAVPKSDASAAFRNWLRRAEPSRGNARGRETGPVQTDTGFVPKTRTIQEALRETPDERTPTFDSLDDMYGPRKALT